MGVVLATGSRSDHAERTLCQHPVHCAFNMPACCTSLCMDLTVTLTHPCLAMHSSKDRHHTPSSPSPMRALSTQTSVSS